MKIIEDLLANLPNDAPVRSVLVGIHWTVVCSRHCGLASTLVEHKPHGHSRVTEAGHLHDKSGRELSALARSNSLLEVSIGVAAINSMLEVDESRTTELNAGDMLVERGRDKNVVLIGHFPFIPELRQAARQLWVVEQDPAQDEYPASAAANLVPSADIVAITGSALINRTLDDLLALCTRNTQVMVLGPSTPLSPILFDHGVSIISGARIFDERAALRTISQGASLRQVEGVKLLTMTQE